MEKKMIFSSKLIFFVLGFILCNSFVFGKNSLKQEQVNFDDIWLGEGFGSALNALQSTIAASDGLKDSATPITKKASSKMALVAEAPVHKAESSPKNQEALYDFIQRMVTAVMAYAPQGDAAAPGLFDQATQVVVDVVRTPLLARQHKNDLIKTILPRLKTKPFSEQETAAWLAIRPLLGVYLQPNGSVAHLHPLQDVAVGVLQENLAALKGKQVHPVLKQRFNMAVSAFVGRVVQPAQSGLLTRLASLEQLQQLQGVVAESDCVSQPTKDLFKTTSDSFINAITNLRALTAVLSTQLAGDINGLLSIRIASAMQYMNRCDGALKQLAGVSVDAYFATDMQALRNSFAQALVDLVQKKTPDVMPALTMLVHRATETGLLGKAQRQYVSMQMVPQFDAPEVKVARDGVMKKKAFVVSVSKKKNSK
jgi:hypothetical protein